MKLNFDVTRAEYQIIKDILVTHLPSPCKVWVFGSRAKNTARTGSDIDLALEAHEKLDKKVIYNLKEAFTESRLPYRVDIVDMKNIDDSFKQIVQKQRVTFPIQSKNTPRLRFPEFTEAWQEKKLGEVATFSKGKGISKSDIHEDGTLECIRYGELYTHYGEMISKVISKTNVPRGDLILSEANDIIIPASGETQIDIAKASCVLRQDIALGGDLNIIKTPHNGVFLSYYMNSKKKLEIAQMAQGNSVVHLYSSQLKNLNISLTSLAEQQKIADFLMAVDEKIALLNEEYTLMQDYKKGMMQKLFSQKIRFTDENGHPFPNWQEKKLGDVLKEPKQKSVDEPQKYELLTVKLHCKGIEKTGNYPAVTQNGRPYYQRYKDEILIGKQNFHNGGIGIVQKKQSGLICSNAICSYNVVKDNLMFVFFYISRSCFYEKIDDLIGGTGQKEISKKEFDNLKISIPSLPEQQKIADFLTALDQKITTIKAKINQTTQFKKSLLQQMFV